MQKVNKIVLSPQSQDTEKFEVKEVQVEATEVIQHPLDVMKEVLTHFDLIEMLKTVIIRKDAQTSEWLDSMV